MKLLALITLLSLISCGKSGGGGSSCKASKEAMSTWTSRKTGYIYDMSACAKDNICEVKFGGGACDDNRGDFTIYVDSDGTAMFGNCAQNTLLDTATYKVTCDNLLKIKYDSDGETEIFE